MYLVGMLLYFHVCVKRCYQFKISTLTMSCIGFPVAVSNLTSFRVPSNPPMHSLQFQICFMMSEFATNDCSSSEN